MRTAAIRPMSAVKELDPANAAGLALGVVAVAIWDAASDAGEPLAAAFAAAQDGHGWWSEFALQTELVTVPFLIGLLAILWLRWAPDGTASLGSGGRLALGLAMAFGLHNFVEASAVRSALTAGSSGGGLPILVALALEAVPQGLALMAVLTLDDSPDRVFVALLAGLAIGPALVGGLMGMAIAGPYLSITALALALGLLASAGSVLAVIATKDGRPVQVATFFALGLLLAVLAEVALGASGA